MKQRSKVSGERAKARSLKATKRKRAARQTKRLAPLRPMLVSKQNSLGLLVN